MEFPLFKTKIDGLEKKFNFLNPSQEREYFKIKAGKEIEKLKVFLEKNTFIAYLIGKKNSGKGTYAKFVAQLVGPEKIIHLSIGDIVRKAEQELKDSQKREDLLSFLKRYYRGFVSLEDNIKELENREAKKLLSTEFILTLIKREIRKYEKKTLFIDGFPRDFDQISFSLFFRDLFEFRDDPDIFVLVNVPNSVIEERIKWRRICPKCQTPRNLRLLPTRNVGFDEKNKEFYLICDYCGERMVKKEFDEFGIEPIKDRLIKDEEIMQKILLLQGVPKIFLRNTVPVDQALQFIDDYEITPQYDFEYSEKEKKVIVKETPWIVKDDFGRDSYSLLVQPVVVSFLHQLVNVLNL